MLDIGLRCSEVYRVYSVQVTMNYGSEIDKSGLA